MKEAQACGPTQRLDGALGGLPLCQKRPQSPWRAAPLPWAPLHPLRPPRPPAGPRALSRWAADQPSAGVHTPAPQPESRNRRPRSRSSLRGPASHGPDALLFC